MKIRISISLACVALSGCVLSVEPVIPESDATMDKRLLGSWQDASGPDRATVTRADGNNYKIAYTSDGRTGIFGARLGLLGKHQFLDVWPVPQNKNQDTPDDELLITGHLLVLLDIKEDEIGAAIIEPDPLLERIRSGDVQLAHSDSNDQMVLTGTTEELRSALGPYLEGPDSLSEAMVWRRPSGDQQRPLPVSVPCFEAAAWREADQLFRSDSHWLGADVASSVALGKDRILWMFGDTLIDPSGSGSRKNSTMVSNSVAIQTGSDPSKSTIDFYWGNDSDENTTAMFPDRGDESLWFGSGVRVEDRLLLFFSRTIRNTGTGLGFQSVGGAAVVIENPDAEPSAWVVRPLDMPTNHLGIALGFAASFRLGDYVYALGSQDPVKSHPVFAARWPSDLARQGKLLEPEWWAGDRIGWVPDASSTSRWPLFENGQSELTIHYDETAQRFLSVHTKGFGHADVMMRASPTLTGTWSKPQIVYRPPENNRPVIWIYAGKAHPELTGADLVLTYATNTPQFADVIDGDPIYYPRFVRLTRCESTVQ